MKKMLLFLTVIIFGISLVTTAQILNPGFENWTNGDPDDWASSNVPEAGLVNVTQTTDIHSGTYALKGDVINFFGTPMAPVIQSGPDATGFAISEQYRVFELYYKFMSVGGDKFSVNVALYKEGNPIAQGAVANPTSVATYTHLSVPLVYTIEELPDLAIIQLSITGPVTGPDVHVGSFMFIDDLSFSLETGIGQDISPDLAGKCFPNPASDILNILFNDNIPGEITLKVFDIFGKEVKTLPYPLQIAGRNSFQVSVGDLAPGLYFYSVIGLNRHYTGKFNVSR